MTDHLIPDDWRDLSARERDILLAIELDGPGNGTQIHERVAGEGRDSATITTTYRTLTRLRDRGYVDRRECDGRENEYRLTDDGRRVLRAAMLLWDRLLEYA